MSLFDLSSARASIFVVFYKRLRTIIPLVDKEQGGEFLDRVRSMRRQFAIEMGLVIPPIHIRDNLQLKSSEYRIMLKGGLTANRWEWGILFPVNSRNSRRKM